MKTLLFLLLVPILFVSLAFGVEHRVPEDFVKIQSAIEAAQDGDRVLIADGLYRERLNFLGKAITVCGNIEAPERVIIKPNTAGSVVVFKNGERENSVLCGVTLRGATTDYGGGAYIRNASPTLHHLVVDSCMVTGSGGGIYCTGRSGSQLSQIMFVANSAENGGGLCCYDLSTIYANCLQFKGCKADKLGGGILISKGSWLQATNIEIDSCHGVQAGGGISCVNESRLDLSYFTITNCKANQGGGITVSALAGLVARNGRISDCHASSIGGGFYIVSDQSLVERVLLVSNYAEDEGSAIYIYPNNDEVATLILSQLTITKHKPEFHENEEDFDGWLLSIGRGVTYTNNIAFGNLSERIRLWPERPLYYSLISDPILLAERADLFELGVITGDPLFRDIENDDYSLEFGSPCLDTGDPDAPLDPDGSRADMGCYPYKNLSLVTGYVHTMDHPAEAIEGALVQVVDGLEAFTDEVGYYQIAIPQFEPFDIFASKENFQDSAIAGFELFNDTIRVDFQLASPKVLVQFDGNKQEVIAGDSTRTIIRIQNNGTGVLNWKCIRYLSNKWSEIPWSTPYSLPLNLRTDPILFGVAFCAGNYVLSSLYESEYVFIVVDRDGNQLLGFPQPGANNTYMADLDSDGESCYGIKDDKVYRFTLDGHSEELFNSKYEQAYSIAWDSQRSLIWVAGNAPGSSLIAYDQRGNIIHNIEKPEFTSTGLAFWQDAPLGNQLVLLRNYRDVNQRCYYAPDEGRWSEIDTIAASPTGTPRFYSISDQIAPDGSLVMLSATTGGGSNVIHQWTVGLNFSWMPIAEDERAGSLHPGEEKELTLEFNTVGLDTGKHEITLKIEHDGFNEPAYIPIELTVIAKVSVNSASLPLPAEFAVTALYPNPFNARLNISYALPQAGEVYVVLFDLNGREVHRQIAGTMTAGYHSLTLDCSHLPTGLYLVKVNTANGSITKKALLLK